jgi:archaellum component FlaC
MDEEVEIILQQDSVDVTEPLVADYILPKASANTLGGVKIGDNINISSDGHISVPMASADTLGLIKIGSGLTIDANGVVTASGEYELPQATKTTLGGVYLDDELNDQSVNPVQNATLTTVISGIDSNVTDLTDSVDDLTDTVTEIGTTVTGMASTVSTLNSTVSGLSTTVSGQSSAIATNTSDIGTINTTLTNHGNDIATIGGQVSDLYQDISETYTYEDIDDTIWTAGDIEIRGKGFYAVMYIQLEGTLSIPTGSSVTLYTLPNDAIPAYDAFGGADIVDGSISIKVDSTNGNINLINNNTTSVNVGKLNASIPIIYGSI